MPDVVHYEIVAIAPPRHHEMISRSQVVMPEGLMKEEIARAGIGRQSKTMFNEEKFHGLDQRRPPAETFAGGTQQGRKESDND